MRLISSVHGELVRLRVENEALREENRKLRHIEKHFDWIVQDACDEAWDGWKRANLAEAIATGAIVLFPGGKQT